MGENCLKNKAHLACHGFNSLVCWMAMRFWWAVQTVKFSLCLIQCLQRAFNGQQLLLPYTVALLSVLSFLEKKLQRYSFWSGPCCERNYFWVLVAAMWVMHVTAVKLNRCLWKTKKKKKDCIFNLELCNSQRPICNIKFSNILWTEKIVTWHETC